MNPEKAIDQISFECEIPRSSISLFKSDPKTLWFWIDLEDSYLLSFDSDGNIDVWERSRAI